MTAPGFPKPHRRLRVPLAAARQEFGQQEWAQEVDLPRPAGASEISAASGGDSVARPWGEAPKIKGHATAELWIFRGFLKGRKGTKK